MSWLNVGANNVPCKKEVITLPSSTGSAYSSVIDFVGPNTLHEHAYVNMTFKASAISGTNIDLVLFGSETTSSADAVDTGYSIAALTDATVLLKNVDLNQYGFPYYFIKYTVDADEDANTLTIKVFG